MILSKVLSVQDLAQGIRSTLTPAQTAGHRTLKILKVVLLVKKNLNR